MLRGKEARTLEDTILSIQKELERFSDFNKKSSEYFRTVEARVKQSVQGLGTIRFNPFKGTGQGGGQSFSTALVNEKGNGVVLSSLYSRDRVSLFAKPLKNFTSDFELTDEEQEAIRIAKTEASLE